MATYVERATSVIDGLLDKNTPAAQLLNIANRFVRYAGVEAINEKFGTDYADIAAAIAGLTNEQKAQQVVDALYAAGEAVVRRAAEDDQRVVSAVDIENAGQTAVDTDLVV